MNESDDRKLEEILHRIETGQPSELARAKERCVNVRNLSEENPDNKGMQESYITAQMDVIELEYKANLRKVT